MSMHEGLPVAGYRPQSDEAIDLVNTMKMREETILRVLDDLAAAGTCDPRWLAIGRTDLERAFMAINRAIFNPARVALPFDRT